MIGANHTRVPSDPNHRSTIGRPGKLPAGARGFLLGALGAASLAMVWTAFAAPILPEQRIPHPFRSLAHLKKVRIGVAQVSGEMRLLGINAAEVRRVWRKPLEQAGLKVIDESDEADVPMLQLKAMGLTDPEVKDGHAYLLYLTLHQPVHLPRLEERLTLPTYQDIKFGIEEDAMIRRVVHRKLEQIIMDFVQRMRLASAGAP